MLGDKKTKTGNNPFVPEVVSYSGYFPFGMQMQEDTWQSPLYRYGYNGKEKDGELHGEGNSYDYGFRMYDPRVGKFLKLDPLTKCYPWYSPYQFAGNTPIQAVDLDGLEPKSVVGPAYPVYTRLGVQNFYKLNQAAATLLNLATGVDTKVLQETWLRVDQGMHNTITHYEDGGAITMGKYIFLTSDYGDPSKKGNDTREWIDIISHEVGHRQQANDMNPFGYFIGYLVDGLKAIIKRGSTDPNVIHNDLEMEVDAEARRIKFLSFMKSYDYTDSKGKDRNSVVDILEDEKYSDKQKSQLILDMYIQSTTPKDDQIKSDDKSSSNTKKSGG